MRAAPAPRIRPRIAAIQQADRAPSTSVLTSTGSSAGTGSTSKSFPAAYDDWQTDAKAAARTVGAARFTANMFAITAGRVDLLVEERTETNEWVPTTDPYLVNLMDEYRNDLLGQNAAELLRYHAWHYQVAGEGLLVTADGDQGYAEWMVLSTRAAEWDRPAKGQVTFRLTPGGSIKSRDAFAVPRNQAIRFWMPDEEYVVLPISPMTSAMNDLRRWQDLSRYAHRVALSYLAMAGLLWTPKTAHEQDEETEEVLDDTLTEAMAEVAKRDPLVDLYQKIARTSVQNDDRLESVAPAMVWWGEKGDEPKWVKIGEGLDSEGIAHRTEALMDFARGVDAPGSMVTAGGGATANHWNEWLNEERFHGSVAPLIDRMTHQDLTLAFLIPRLRLGGYDESRYRVGYDATDVVVHPDRSDMALRAWLAGLLGAKPALGYLGFDDSELATEEDLARLSLVLGKMRSPDAVDAPVGPSTVDETAPSEPSLVDDLPLPALPEVAQATLSPYLPAIPLPAGPTIAVGAGTATPPTGVGDPLPVPSAVRSAAPVRSSGTGTEPLPRSRPRSANGKKVREDVRAYRALLDRIARARRDTGRRLLAGAEVALAEALRLAGVRAIQKARNKSRTTAAALSRAWENREPIASYLAAIGATDESLLAGAFTTYEEQAAEWFRALREQERKAIAAAGFDPDALPETSDDDRDAAAFLAAALLAIARQRILTGTDPLTLSGPGEVSGTVPPQFAAQSLRIAEGTATFVRSADPTVLPTAAPFPTGRQPVQDYLTTEIRDRLAETLRDERALLADDPEARQRVEDALADVGEQPTEYAWAWGFYGEPTTAFDPHLALDGYVTVDPEGDPNLYNTEAWPESPLYQPGDHLGCSCEWVALLPETVESSVFTAVE